MSEKSEGYNNSGLERISQLEGRICPDCGNQLREGIKFCTQCGKKITSSGTKRLKRVVSKIPLTRQLRTTRKRTKRFMGRRDDEEDLWLLTRGGADQYTETFQGVLGNSHIEDLIQERLEPKHPFMILDLMGYGFVIRDIRERLQNPNIKGLSVALSDFRWDEIKETDRDNLDCLIADVTQSSTWEEIRNWLTKRNMEGFDLILCRPFGAMEDLPKSPYFYAIFLNKMWQVLNPKRGILLTEVPEGVSSKTMDNLCKYLESQHETASWSSGRPLHPSVLRLERTPDTPEKLELPASLYQPEKI